MLNQLALLIPLFLCIALLEWYVTFRQGKQLFTKESTVMNMTLGAIDQVFSLADFFLLFLVLSTVYNHYHLFEMEKNWLQYLTAYVAVDFVSYWYHRFSHRVNILWAGHITHHSGEHFNYTNGFRGSPLQGFNRIPFWVVLPLIGFDPFILVFTLQISGIYDFWLHTQSIPRLGFLEKILITPSLHRVHHGKNDIYIDKNYGSTFVIWDQLFGTLQRETEPVKYGIKSETYTDNDPVKAITFHYSYLWRTISNSKAGIRALKLLWMPPEWQLPGVESRQRNDNLVSASRSENKGSGLRVLAWYQLVCGALGLITLLYVKNLLPFYLFALLAAAVIASLVNSARIFNGNVAAQYRTAGLWRTSVLLLALSGTAAIMNIWWLFFPCLLLAVNAWLFYRIRPELNPVVFWNASVD